LKDKCGDKVDAYTDIALICSAVAKLFELILLDLYNDQLCSDDSQFGFKTLYG